MECLNCGGAINSLIAGQVVKCEYCGTATAWLPKIDIDQSSELTPEIDKLLKLVQLDIDSKRYSQANEVLNRIIATEPTCWQAYANLALVKFWLGDDSYSHLTEVREYLNKAAAFSNDANLIANISGGISFNTAQLIKIQDPSGDGLINAINALLITREMRPDFPERDALVNDFTQAASNKILNRLDGFLKRDGKSFDPPRSELLAAGGLLLVSKKPDTGLLKKFLAYVDYKNSKQKIEDVNLQSKIEALRSIYLKNTGESKTPSLVFSLFKGPVIQ
jgi:hypothetical protein